MKAPSISSVQKGIWLTQALQEGSTLFNIGGYALIDGPLDVPLLQECIDAILTHADAIRIGAAVFCNDREPQAGDWQLAPDDRSHEQEADDQCRQWMEKDMALRFPEGVTPLTIKLLRSTPTRHYLYVKAHHLIFDGYSMALFFNQVSRLYSSGSGKEASLLQPGLYREFIAREKTYRRTAQYKADKQFWRRLLDGHTDQKAFLSCAGHSGGLSLRGKRKETVIGRTLFSAIGAFCRQQGCSPLHYFVSCILILNRCYNNGDPVIGVPIHNRRDRRARNTLGPYTNVLPFYTGLTREMTFLQVLRAVSGGLKECYKHSALPLYDIQEDLDVAGTLYNLSFSYQPVNYDSRIGEAKVTVRSLHPDDQQEDLIIHLLEYSSSGDLVLAFDHKTDVFSDEVAEGMMRHYCHLLDRFLTNPETAIGGAEYLDEWEKEKLLVRAGVGKQRVRDPEAGSILPLFEEQAKRSPELVAVDWSGGELSYGVLNEKANRYARWLADRYGIGAGHRVGVLMEREGEMIICLLAILKTGAAYVPMDLRYPESRNRLILEDSECTVVADMHLYSAFLRVEEQYAGDNPAEKPSGESLSYVIYTSGSTGRPKGVMIEHRNTLAFIDWCRHEFQNPEIQTILAVTSICFDLSVFELFYPLCTGRRIRLLENALALPAHLQEKAGLLLNTVPSVVGELLSSGIELEGLAAINMAGEALPPGLLKKLPVGRTEIRNLYGPTEDTTYSTRFLIRDETDLSIGTPKEHSFISILNQDQRFVPDRTTGEICISGAGLARGYWHLPAMTDAKFIVHPYNPNERIYRTGDLGRWRADGNIEFLGRADRQVKIRGHRIEPGEIEYHLNRMPGVDNAVVFTGKETGDAQLVAYIATGVKLKGSDLKEALAAVLPVHLIPAQIVFLKAFPLNANGKIDRAKLPAPGKERARRTGAAIVPADEIEKKLLGIWGKVLARRKAIGLTDDFFELGGHSLKTLALANQIQKQFGVRLGIKTLFEIRDVKGQAALIRRAPAERITIAPADGASSYPFSFAQRRLWLLAQFANSATAYHMPGVVRLSGEVDADLLDRSFRQIIARHESLRTVFRKNGEGEYNQVVLSPEDQGFFLATVDWREGQRPGTELETLIHDQLNADFDWKKGPLLRALLIRASDHQWVLVFVIHHIVCDGWSLRVLIKELSQVYNGHRSGAAVHPAPLTIQYKDYTNWQYALVKSSAFDAHRKYWTEQLRGALPVLNLPLDKARPVDRSFNGDRVRVGIRQQIVRKLRRVCAGQDATFHMGLFAVLSGLLFRYTGQTDIVIGAATSGRDHSDLEDQIGFYANMMACRIRFDGMDSFSQLLAKVRLLLTENQHYQDLPFSEVMELLGIQPARNRNPLFDVVINYMDAEDSIEQQLRLDGADITGVGEGQMKKSKFDLLFQFATKDGEWELVIEFDTDLFSAATIQRMAGNFNRLLAACATNQTTPVGQLDLLGREEIRRLLAFNNPRIGYPKKKNIVQLFEAQANRTPANIALTYGGVNMSYELLNSTANRLADHLLRTCGWKKEDLIGILLDRSEWMVIAMLAILKAGCAYVPVDPGYPQERIDYIIADSQCKLMIDAAWLSLFQKEMENCETGNPELDLSPEALAYVIYTSGSTGRPKGAMLAHGNVVRLFINDGGLFDFNEKDVWTLFHSYCFDFSVWEMYGALLFGGRLVVLDAATTKDPGALTDVLRTEKVSILNQTPSAFYNFSDTALRAAADLPALRYIIFGGEALNPSRLRAWRVRYPQTKLVNMYGITETTVHVSYKEIGEAELSSATSKIGVPIPTTYCYVLDDQLQLLPMGVAGDLYVGGAGLARGYLNKAELTRRVFLSNPFRPGERLYVTGDIVRINNEGEMEYLGRKDAQVKIRGHRIEPGEVETALNRIADISNAVVVPTEDGGEAKLLAYIVSERPLTANQLRKELRTLIPDYMIPADFYRVDELPVTSNGKIDRGRLKAIGSERLIASGGLVLPRNQTESKLIAILSRITGRPGDELGVTDNFFDLGISSIDVIKLLDLVNEEFSFPIKIVDLYRYPSIDRLITLFPGHEPTGVPVPAGSPASPVSAEPDISGSVDEMIDLFT